MKKLPNSSWCVYERERERDRERDFSSGTDGEETSLHLCVTVCV